MTPTKRLTDRERARYDQCKQIIKDGLQTCFKVGMALIEIRDQKYYLEDFDTFDEFSEATFGMKHSHAYRLIEAAEVKNSISVSPIGDKLKNEGQARELAKAPVDKRLKVLEDVAKDGPVTAKSIKAKVQNAEYEMQEPKEMQEPAEPEVVRDELGWPIPEDLVPLWNRRQILKDMMADLSRMKCEIARGQKEQDDLYAHIGSAATAEFDQVRWLVKHALPWVVCTECQGRPTLNVACQLCKTTGFLIERDVEILPTVKDVLKIRTKMLESKK